MENERMFGALANNFFIFFMLLIYTVVILLIWEYRELIKLLLKKKLNLNDKNKNLLKK